MQIPPSMTKGQARNALAHQSPTVIFTTTHRIVHEAPYISAIDPTVKNLSHMWLVHRLRHDESRGFLSVGRRKDFAKYSACNDGHGTWNMEKWIRRPLEPMYLELQTLLVRVDE